MILEVGIATATVRAVACLL